MSANPYRIEGPALISFSGGRTSGYMLWHILDAYDGKLPENVHVCFANTGKEREETLRFVYECGTQWDVPIRWIERRWPGRTADHSLHFEEVGFNSAARRGEPFAELIRRKQYLPSAGMRYCTTELKVRAMKHFMLSLGYQHWINAIGLRGDEMLRVFKQFALNEQKKQRWTTVMPMATQAGGMVAQRDVQAFWKEQPFDLGIHSADGNCDICFLKHRTSRMRRIRQDPTSADWWIEQENLAKCSMKDGHGEHNARFDANESITQLRDVVLASPLMDLCTPEDAEFDAECGLWCAGEAA
ncbi:MAG TPA: Nin-like protein [Sphingobium sp.]|uniref:Nin-like protein n=1 Tax=Sphingobium sp. TaxID=1912891 RepID=UPI002ED68B9F